VANDKEESNCFNSFCTSGETVKTVPVHNAVTDTPLKQGVNEKLANCSD